MNSELLLRNHLSILKRGFKKYTIEEVFVQVQHIHVESERKRQLILETMKDELREYQPFYKMQTHDCQVSLYPMQIKNRIFGVPWKYDGSLSMQSIVPSMMTLQPEHRQALRKALKLIKKDSKNYPSKFSSAFQALLPTVYEGNEMHLDEEWLSPYDSWLQPVDITTFFYVLRQCFSQIQVHWWTTLYDVDSAYICMKKLLQSEGKLQEGPEATDQYVGCIYKQQKVLMYHAGKFMYCDMEDFGSEYALVCVVLKNNEEFNQTTIWNKIDNKDLEQLAKEKPMAKAVRFTWEIQSEEIPFVILSETIVRRAVSKMYQSIVGGELEMPVEKTDYFPNLALEEIREFDLLQSLFKTLKYF
mgnify:CR=1 FL=1